MRLVDADTLKQKKVYSHERHEYVVPVAEIDWASTADVVEVKHSEWIKKVLNCGDRGLKETVYECSLCGVDFPYGIDFPYHACQWNYCPNCGAYMKEGNR